jgi:hypothetical protein
MGCFMTGTPIHVLSGDQLKKNEMGGAREVYGVEERYIQCFIYTSFSNLS